MPPKRQQPPTAEEIAAKKARKAEAQRRRRAALSQEQLQAEREANAASQRHRRENMPQNQLQQVRKANAERQRVARQHQKRRLSRYVRSRNTALLPENFNGDKVKESYLGPIDAKSTFCDVKHFRNELMSNCCHKETIALEEIRMHPFIKNYMSGSDLLNSKNFMENSAMAFSSMEAQVDQSVTRHSVVDVQKKWDNLRTQFLKELKNANQKEESGSTDYVVKWRYFPALSFLQKTQNKRNTITTFQLPTSGIKTEPDAGEEEDDRSLSTQSTCHETDFGIDSNDNTDKSWHVETLSHKKIAKKRKMKERNGMETEKTLQIMGKYFEKNAAHSALQEDDEDDLFSRFLVIEMKKVKDPNVQRNMKRKLIDLVMDAQVEEERIKHNQENSQQQTSKQVFPRTVQWDTLFGAIRQSIQQVMVQSNAAEQMQPELAGNETASQQPQFLLNLTLGS